MNASQPVATSLLSCEPIASAVRVSARRAWRAFAALVCVFALAGNVAADTPAAVTFAGGNGTQADPFQA